MDWILHKSKKIEFHTNLKEVTKPFREDIGKYNWLISDLEVNTDKLDTLPIDHEKEYFILTSDEFQFLVSTEIQIIWGAILAIPKYIPIEISQENLPYVEGNDKVWEPGNIQHDEAEIEIDCFDSSYTIVKFRKKSTSKLFRNYFEEAIDLSKFK
ncbi:hypothetical protein [Rufibacter roseus]|uniref:Uncharacterized protein n=1 Tax=Rufibacter roseus TaxID=1567108 RepID=A0ABW2DRF0_9BACT|nr:hypothetical protein [Rufibacter roseus]